MLPFVLQLLVLFMALAFLAESESKEKKKTDKRGILINVGNGGKVGSGSSGDSGGYRGGGDSGGHRGGSNIDHLAQG